MKDGGSAFPIINEFKIEDGVSRIEAGAPGMSLRDWFAGQALAGLLVNSGEVPQYRVSTAVCMSYEFADAMLEARKLK